MNNKRLVNTFLELVKVDSESGNEGKFQKLLKKKFEELGLYVYEDSTMEKTGLGAGNLYCVLEGDKNAEPILFSCHSDTVTPGVNIEPTIINNVIYSSGETILAADDKAGIAVLLEMVAMLKENKTKHRKLEFVFTVGEEVNLIGAKAFDMNKLEAKHGFIWDSAGPIGGVIMASPNIYFLEVLIEGKAAHAGVEPEKGISAIEIAAKAIASMKLGRIDDTTTSNVGTIHGGIATNIVADETKIRLEVRGIYEEKCQEIIRSIIDNFKNTADDLGGTVTIDTTKVSSGYRLTDDSYTVRLAKEALENTNINIDYQISGGASDANIFNSKGIETLNMSVGYEKMHTVDEFLPIDEMEKAVAVAYYIATQP